ncbi:AEC family transporter [Thiomonas sp. X19]|uniref:AEC family transporter n=1 Tax=Thiomonas sp. X19 TaxID=1050370 RepID=UPI001E50CD1B|nr:AEC family transporter [Thiomonas sp. X19]
MLRLMSHNAMLLFPDFALIALGFALSQWTSLKRDVWGGVERLVYYVLFPVLLFSTSSRGYYTLAGASSVLLAGIGALLCGIALAYAAFWLRADKRCTASGVQCAFRFNSYIALAVADRLGGAQAVSLVAVLIAFGVPLCNAAAVWALARHAQRGLLRELLRNPLIVATAAGLVAHSLGLRPPELVLPVLDRIGNASIAMGLMTVGAGLQLRGIHREWRLTVWLMAVRHALIPLIAWGLALWLRLTPLEAMVVVMFAAMPTASSAYVLAARMGGDGPYVAGLVSLSTLLGAVSLPVFLSLMHFG